MGILENINLILKEKNMTINELEKRADLKEGIIATWNKSFPSIDKLQRVGNILDKSIYFLVHGEEPPEDTIIITSDDGIKVLKGEEAKKIIMKIEELDNE